MATITAALEDKGTFNAFNCLCAASHERNPARILIASEVLRNSIAIQSGADFGRIGANVAYAAICQFGGAIQRAGYGGTVRLCAKNRRGELERNKAHPRLAIFARKDHKRFVEWHFEAAAYTIRIPARPFLPFLGTRLQDGA